VEEAFANWEANAEKAVVLLDGEKWKEKVPKT